MRDRRSGVTDRDGKVRFSVAGGSIVVGERASVDLLLPGGTQILEVRIEALGAEFDTSPPAPPAGK